MGVFSNKREYQRDVIQNWIKRGCNLTKTKLARKLGISRPTLNKLLKQHANGGFIAYGRKIPNNFIPPTIRQSIWNETRGFLTNLNANRNVSVYLPTFEMLKPFITSASKISQTSFSNIIKANDFYLPSCTRKTKNKIRKRIREAGKIKSFDLDLIRDLEDIKIPRLYKKKAGIPGDILEMDACPHPWFDDEYFHLYRIVDTRTGYRLCQYVEKEETSMGYLRMLKAFLKQYGAPRVMVVDKRKSFWNGENTTSQISLMLMELGIEVIATSEPTSKPNVERSFHDAQQLYPLECFKRNIKTLKQFRVALPSFLELSNKRYNKKMDLENTNLIHISDQQIDRTMNLRITRKVTKGNTLVIQGEHYIPVREGKRQLMTENQTIEVLANDVYDKYIMHRNSCYPLKLLEDKYEIMHFSKEWSAIEFEKRKTLSMYKTLEKKKHEINKLIQELKSQFPNIEIDL